MMCCQCRFFTVNFYPSYIFSVFNVQSLSFLSERKSQKICHDNQSPDSRYRGNSNSVRYIKFTSNKWQQATHVYNLSNMSQIFTESLIIPLQILNIMRTLSHYTHTDCIKNRKQINDNLQHLQILGIL
jgi:hypothetical protein